ncbi:hypothetical protein FB451DRAFT_1300457 [Mycena latifolia]|nr:hypothetical protein FB451DRAFT_1300457 [Mycena latifolia]
MLQLTLEDPAEPAPGVPDPYAHAAATLEQATRATPKLPLMPVAVAEKQFDTLKAEIATLTQASESHRAALDSLRTVADAAAQERDVAQADVREKAAAIERLQAALADLHARMDELLQRSASQECELLRAQRVDSDTSRQTILADRQSIQCLRARPVLLQVTVRVRYMHLTSHLSASVRYLGVSRRRSEPDTISDSDCPERKRLRLETMPTSTATGAASTSPRKANLTGIRVPVSASASAISSNPLYATPKPGTAVTLRTKIPFPFKRLPPSFRA